MIKQIDTASTFIRMELVMKESGKMIYSMVKVKRFGLIIPDMKVPIMREKNMESVFTFGKMDHLTMEIGLKIG